MQLYLLQYYSITSNFQTFQIHTFASPQILWWLLVLAQWRMQSDIITYSKREKCRFTWKDSGVQSCCRGMGIYSIYSWYIYSIYTYCIYPGFYNSDCHNLEVFFALNLRSNWVLYASLAWSLGKAPLSTSTRLLRWRDLKEEKKNHLHWTIRC